ncbi:Oxysterol-binding protein 9 [Phytophthora nicotianae]|uniref:Oxysterol-binding protein 9 n=1 Tax=Phytophthora nicotianae TaxID=4792 RepID=A0A0W8DKY7_PHYNI|nr:Oxysterol-binding protein 9 [Phytophthora nicotianae]
MLAIRRAAAAAPKRAFASPAQAMGFTDLKDKEKAAEAVFFNKQDEKALRKLLQKMKGRLKHHVEHDKKGLKSIPGLNLTDEQVNELLKWKHQQ